LNVVVCVKSVPNAQGTPDLGEDHLVPRDGEAILDPGDEFAVEAGLQLAEVADGEVTLVSMGPENAVSAIRKGLSMGAHRAILVTDPALRGSDALATARVLAAVISRAGFDVVLAGVESTDGYTGTVPVTVAELLGVPSATFARALEITDGVLRIERQTEGGYDVVEAPLPALATVTGSAAEPRYPTLKGIMQAKQKPLEQLSLADLSPSLDDLTPMQRVVSVERAPEQTSGELLEAGDDAVRRLGDFLADAKVI
jgi:electron transfer flavoprotein beta subunit